MIKKQKKLKTKDYRLSYSLWLRSMLVMEPVCDHWRDHNRLGESILAGMKNNDIPIFGSGNMELDLTQTSYSTIPSVDIEVGDCTSDYTEKTQSKLTRGIIDGVNTFFE